MFIAEMQLLENDGFQPEGLGSQLHVKNHVLYVMQKQKLSSNTYIKGHSDYYGCSNCVQKGLWIGKMILPMVDYPLRTLGISPFTKKRLTFKTICQG